MDPSPLINWPELLHRYPGRDIGERFQALRGDKSYREVSEEVGCSIAAWKSFCWRFNISYRMKRWHVVRRRPRMNYAAVMNALIEELAEDKGMTPAEYREWTHGAGEEEFFIECDTRKIPLFRCNYQKKGG